jgi:signal transduction histidine kinase
VRRRIVVLTVVAAVLATVLFGVPLAVLAAQLLLDNERTEAEQAADLAAITVAADVAAGRTVDVAQDGDLTVGWYAPRGERLTGVGPALAEPVVRAAVDGRVHGDDDVAGALVVAVPVEGADGVAGVVRASSDYSAVRARIAGTWALMAVLAGAAVAAALAVSRWQARRLAGPLEALATTATRLGDGDFSVRTARSGIPEIDAAGTALDSTAARLGGLVARERAFSADASHQLRTPLTGLRLHLETALADPAAAAASLARALDAADRLDRTVGDLLALARDTHEGREPLAVPELVEEVRTVAGPLLTAQGRALEVAVDDDLPPCRAATAAVRQVLGVLVDNAVVHGAGTVRLTVRDAGDALAFDVADEGTGPVGEEVFGGRRSPAARGTGIGLPLARSLAEAEGGRLRVARPSPPVFSLLLPAAEEGQPVTRRAPA